MQQRLRVLDDIRVAKPCPAAWEYMQGNDQVRHCTHCECNVYNISAMSREEAASLIEAHEGRVCVRFYRRNDGKIMTRDCPRGLAKVRARFLTLASMLMWIFIRAIPSQSDNVSMGAVAVSGRTVCPPSQESQINPDDYMTGKLVVPQH